VVGSVVEGRERLYRTEAVILRRQNMGESDRLLTLYTPTRGKLRVVAKGVRKPTSRKAGHLELYLHSNLLVARGQNLDIVTQAETIHPFRALRQDLERASHAHYVAELVDRFASEGEENRALFALLVNALQWLCETQDLGLTVRFYELRVLALEGYQPQLFTCLGCGEMMRPVVNYFSPERGGMLCPRCGEGLIGQPGVARQVRPLSVNALKVLRYLQTHDYEACRRLRLKPGTQREVERVMQHYITFVLERELKSVDFMRQLREEGG
jgi:DNA repair protein RecO (recombination protein O)